MSTFKNEVIQRLKEDIRSKLDQIGAFVDNELADYIMVLVANQKSKYQMKDDLSLFLGADTDQFVNWLHNTLKQLQLNANQSDDKKVPVKVADKVFTNEVVAKEVVTKELPKKETPVISESKAKHKKVKHLSKNEEISDETADKSDAMVGNSADESAIKSDNEMVDKEVNPEDVESNDNKPEKQEQNDSEVILRLNPDGGDVDELLQENDVNDNNNKLVSNKDVTNNDDIDKDIKMTKALPVKRQMIKTVPISTITAVVSNRQKSDEEESVSEPKRKPVIPSVASVVRVSQRKPSVLPGLQANKNLLLKAMKDAHKSTAKKRTIDEVTVEYTPTPIKRRLGEKQEMVFNDEEVVEQSLDPQDLRNYLKVKSDKNDDQDMEEVSQTNRLVMKSEVNPQFVVTLDGVDHNKYLNSNEGDDQMIDEDMDPEFSQNEDMADNDMENDDLGANKVNERCRYWPNCTNDECGFQHPTTPCKTFPNCRFGDKCLYIHPKCKFDSMCSRKECPFTHTSKRKIPVPPPYTSAPNSVKHCKYQSNCKNMNCPFIHPKMCRFGSKCHSRDCQYVHPNGQYTDYTAGTALPQPHQLKWKASDHISERQFAANDEQFNADTS